MVRHESWIVRAVRLVGQCPFARMTPVDCTCDLRRRVVHVVLLRFGALLGCQDRFCFAAAQP